MRRAATSRARWAPLVLGTLVALAGALTDALAAAAADPPAPCLLAPVSAPVRDPFRSPGCTWCAGNRGIEYATAAGTTVRAGAGGVVSWVGVVAGTRYVVVDHPSGLRTTYGNLAGASVAAGAPVAAGAAVGATSDRLHFGVRRGDTYLDPARYLVRRTARPRLVPTDGGSRRPASRFAWSCPARDGAARGPDR